MKKSLECGRRGCGCRARGSSRYCSEECQLAAAEPGDCPCAHPACVVMAFGRSGAARNAAVDLDELEREGRKQRERL
jgi:hypothetical protein